MDERLSTMLGRAAKAEGKSVKEMLGNWIELAEEAQKREEERQEEKAQEEREEIEAIKEIICNRFGFSDALDEERAFEVAYEIYQKRMKNK